MKTALVTGGAKRIGRAICLRLSAAGYGVYVHHFTSGEAAGRLCAEIASNGGAAMPIEGDLSNAGIAAGLAERCTGLGSLSALVNNAATYTEDSIRDLKPCTLAAHFDLNLRAPLLLSQGFAARCKEGAIVNLLDFRVAAIGAGFLSYSLSKSALAAATEALALALAPDIRVNAVAPGLVLESAFETGDRFDRLAGDTLLWRGVDPGDVADAVLYLLSAQSVTGTTVPVDAGKRFVTTRGLKLP